MRKSHLLCIALFGLGLLPGAMAQGLALQSLGARIRVGGDRVIGVEQPERFQEVDLSLTWRLPWERYAGSDWGVGTRLMASAGWMSGASDSALVVSALPLIALGSRDGRFALDFGLGAALLSRHQFEQQDFGGHLQFALTLGSAWATASCITRMPACMAKTP